jgi:hypothetical protein
MAIATAAGMLSSTVLTLLVVPVFYLVFDDAAERLHRWFWRRTPAAVDTPAMSLHAAAKARPGETR